LEEIIVSQDDARKDLGFDGGKNERDPQRLKRKRGYPKKNELQRKVTEYPWEPKLRDQNIGLQ